MTDEKFIPPDIHIGNKQIVYDIQRYYFMGYDHHEIARTINIEPENVQLAIHEMDKVGMLDPERCRIFSENAYTLQLLKAKNITIEALAIAVKTYISELQESKRAEQLIESKTRELRQWSKMARSINDKEEKEKATIYLDDLRIEIENLRTYVKKIAPKDILCLTEGISKLEETTKQRVTINQNNIVNNQSSDPATNIYSNITLEKARQIIVNDPVLNSMAMEVRDYNDDELASGLNQFKSVED